MVVTDYGIESSERSVVNHIDFAMKDKFVIDKYADAALIAAAPDLLDGLLRSTDLVDVLALTGRWKSQREAAREAHDELCEVLLRATGIDPRVEEEDQS